MRPVDQTLFQADVETDDRSHWGNCLQACYASLFELPLEDVPHFVLREAWWDAVVEWLEPWGLYPLCITPGDGWRPMGYHLMAGKSPRGDFRHVVVGLNGEMVHDPHPSRVGLETCDEYDILVVYDPMKMAPLDNVKAVLASFVRA